MLTKLVEEERDLDPEPIDLSQLKSQDVTPLPLNTNRKNGSIRSFKQTSDTKLTSQVDWKNANQGKLPVPLAVYYPATVAETVQSVRNSYSTPLRLINVSDPNVLNKAVKLDAKDLLKCYLGLSKSRLTGLVVVTAMAGYALAPAPFAAGSFLCLSLGTALTSAAANTVNQIVEVPYDSQMDRTKNRVLVKERLRYIYYIFNFVLVLKIILVCI